MLGPILRGPGVTADAPDTRADLAAAFATITQHLDYARRSGTLTAARDTAELCAELLRDLHARAPVPPAFGALLVAAAHLLAEHRDFAGVLRWVREATRYVAGYEPAIRLELAALLSLGRSEEARRLASTLTQTEGSHPATLRTRAGAWALLGDYDRACADTGLLTRVVASLLPGESAPRCQ